MFQRHEKKGVGSRSKSNRETPVRQSFPRSAGRGILLAVNDRLGGTAIPVSIAALGIDRLSVRERLDLIEQIWDSLPE